MVNEKLIISKENKAQIVEVRYLENQETSQVNKFFRSFLPTVYCIGDDDGISAGPSFGAKLKADSSNIGAEVKAGVDLVNVKAGVVQARAGLNVDSGISIGPDGVEVKAAGFGVSVGKKMGVSTPFGEVAVNTDDCTIQ